MTSTFDDAEAFATAVEACIKELERILDPVCKTHTNTILLAALTDICGRGIKQEMDARRANRAQAQTYVTHMCRMAFPAEYQYSEFPPPLQ